MLLPSLLQGDFRESDQSQKASISEIMHQHRQEDSLRVVHSTKCPWSLQQCTLRWLKQK